MSTSHVHYHQHSTTTRVGALLPMPSCLGIGGHPSGSRQGHPTVHWGPNNGEAVGGPHQPPNGRSAHSVRRAQDSATSKSSDKQKSTTEQFRRLCRCMVKRLRAPKSACKKTDLKHPQKAVAAKAGALSEISGGSEGFLRTRITKSSCACDCGRRPVSVGAFFFFLHSSSLTQNRALKLRFFVGRSDVSGEAPGGPWEKRKRNKNEKQNEKTREKFKKGKMKKSSKK